MRGNYLVQVRVAAHPCHLGKRRHSAPGFPWSLTASNLICWPVGTPLVLLSLVPIRLSSNPLLETKWIHWTISTCHRATLGKPTPYFWWCPQSPQSLCRTHANNVVGYIARELWHVCQPSLFAKCPIWLVSIKSNRFVKSQSSVNFSSVCALTTICDTILDQLTTKHHDWEQATTCCPSQNYSTSINWLMN